MPHVTQDTNHDLTTNDVSFKALFSKIKKWLNFLLSKWIGLVPLTIIGIVGGYLNYKATNPQYVAELTFVYGETGNAQLAGLSSIASQFGISGSSASSGIFDGTNLIAFMRSRTILAKVALSKIESNGKKTSFADEFIRVYGLRDIWRKKNPKIADITFNNVSNEDSLSLDQSDVLGGIIGTIRAKNLLVGKADKESSIMAIDFKSENELLSKIFVERLIKEVSVYYVDTKTAKYAKNVQILQKQVDSVRQVLNSAIRGVAALADINPNPNPARRTLLAPSQNRQVDVQASTAILTQLVQNLEIAKLSLRNETPLIQVIDAPTLPLGVQKMSLMQSVILGLFAGLFTSILLYTIKYNL